MGNVYIPPSMIFEYNMFSIRLVLFSVIFCVYVASRIIWACIQQDVGQKIMLFMQQSRREVCILSASGSISNASLRQPASSGGNVTYEVKY